MSRLRQIPLPRVPICSAMQRDCHIETLAGGILHRVHQPADENKPRGFKIRRDANH